MALLAIALVVVKPALGDSDAKATGKPTAREELIADKFAELKTFLLELAVRLEGKGEADNGKAIREAIDAGAKADINSRLEKLAVLLNESHVKSIPEIQDAIARGKRLHNGTIEKLVSIREAAGRYLGTGDNPIRPVAQSHILVNLRGICERLLPLQQKVREDAAFLARRVAENDDGKPSRAEVKMCGRLAEQQRQIGAEIDKACELIAKDRSAAAFEASFRQLRRVIATAEERLGKTDPGSLAQQAQDEVIDLIKEMGKSLKHVHQTTLWEVE